MTYAEKLAQVRAALAAQDLTDAQRAIKETRLMQEFVAEEARKGNFGPLHESEHELSADSGLKVE